MSTYINDLEAAFLGLGVTVDDQVTKVILTPASHLFQMPAGTPERIEVVEEEVGATVTRFYEGMSVSESMVGTMDEVLLDVLEDLSSTLSEEAMREAARREFDAKQLAA